MQERGTFCASREMIAGPDCTAIAQVAIKFIERSKVLCGVLALFKHGSHKGCLVEFVVILCLRRKLPRMWSARY